LRIGKLAIVQLCVLWRFSILSDSLVTVSLRIYAALGVNNMKNLTAALLCAALICSMTSSASADTVGFQGAFAPANWTTTSSGGGSTSATVDSSGAPASILMNTSSGDFSGLAQVDYTIVAPVGTTAISFDFAYGENNGDDFNSGVSNAGVLVNGAFTQVATSDGAAGSYSFNVAAGDVVGFRLGTTDNDSEFSVAKFEISNFKSSNPVPEPASLLLLLVAGSAALVADRRRRRRLQKQA